MTSNGLSERQEVIRVPTWNELAGGSISAAAAVIAHEQLIDARWFASIGQVSDRDAIVDRVDSWASATTIFKNAKGKPTIGTLDAPAYQLLRVLDAESSQAMAKAGDRAARDALALGQVRFVPYIPAELPLLDSIAVGDYLTEYVRFLFLEIHAGDVGPKRCTYFRDQLGWFIAGFFPCGWVGDWPVGRMRVF